MILRSVTVLVVVALAGACSPDGVGACQRSARATESGLVVRDLSCGRGRAVERGDVVTVAYSGSVRGGASLPGDDDFTFALGAGQVIAGWEEGIPGMRVGGTRTLVVPPELAFGSGGVRGLVPPDATLVFEVDVLDARDA